LTGVIEYVRDISMQKKWEAEYYQAQKMEAIGTLAGGIAHDFNNLLMGLQGNASLMLLDADPNHPFYQRLKNMETLIQSGADLTRKLLGFARKGRYEVQETDLNELLKKTSDLFGRTRKDIRRHYRLADGLRTVKVDQGQVEQALMNLFLNAGQAMPGGGDLYLETADIHLDDGYHRPFKITPGDYVRISVTDTGVGMDEETRQRIFEPFFTTRAREGRGTGLGLASVYGIVKNHGGLINVYSELNRGTTFTLYFPALEASSSKPLEKKAALATGRETILLVDDEAVIIEVGQALLSSLGYRVLTAGSGREALKCYQEERRSVDLVILDMILPEMDGGEIFDRLKQLNPEIKVLLSSGYSLNLQAAQIMERGCRGFIQKPFTLQELSQKIREILGRTAGERAPDADDK
jgi:CheY-like chemotaxis protein/nitrogen-specific signal transduction histidine kinase